MENTAYNKVNIKKCDFNSTTIRCNAIKLIYEGETYNVICTIVKILESLRLRNRVRERLVELINKYSK